jgi:hypothetical protein
MRTVLSMGEGMVNCDLSLSQGVALSTRGM